MGSVFDSPASHPLTRPTLDQEFALASMILRSLLRGNVAQLDTEASDRRLTGIIPRVRLGGSFHAPGSDKPVRASRAGSGVGRPGCCAVSSTIVGQTKLLKNLAKLFVTHVRVRGADATKQSHIFHQAPSLCQGIGIDRPTVI